MNGRNLTDVTPEPSRVGDVRFRWSFLLLVSLSLLTFAGLLYLTSYMNFFFDEWDFVSWYRPGQPTSILLPHNEHWLTIPILVWKLLFIAFGIRSHVPYEAALLAAHVAAVLLLFTLVRRHSGDLPALATAVTLLVLGAGGTDIVWAFQIAFVGSVAFGLLAMWLLDGSTHFSRRVLAASVALLASIMCSGIGLAFLAAVGVELLVDRRRRRLLLLLVPPIALYGAWFVMYGKGVAGSPGLAGDVLSSHIGFGYAVALSNFVAAGVEASVAGVFGWTGIGAFLLPIVAALVAVHWYRQKHVKSWQIGMTAGLLAQFTIIGLVRAQNGTDTARDPHYVYVGAVFLLPLIADAAQELPWRPRWRPLLTVAFAACLVGNLAQLWSSAVGQTGVMRVENAELQTVEIFRGAPDMALYRPLDSQIAPQLVAARYFAAIDDLGSPVPAATLDTLPRLPDQVVNRVMLNLFGDALKVASDSTRSVNGLPCKTVDSTGGSVLDFRILVGESLVLEAGKSGDADLFLSFLGALPAQPLRHIQLQPAVPEWVHVPDTGKQTNWQLRITTTPVGLLKVCGTASTQLHQTVNYVYQGEGASGALGPGWSVVVDASASGGRAAKAEVGSVSVTDNRYATNTFGATFTPVLAPYDVWFRVRVTSAAGHTPELTLGLWDDTGVRWLGSTSYKASQVGTEYSWVKAASAIIPSTGHYVQFQAYIEGKLGTDWYIDEAVVAPSGSPAPSP